MEKFSEVRIHRLGDSDKATKAYCTVLVAECFVVSGLKIIAGKNGLFVGMPARKDKDGAFHDVAFPSTSEARRELQHVVLEVFKGIDDPTSPHYKPKF